MVCKIWRHKWIVGLFIINIATDLTASQNCAAKCPTNFEPVCGSDGISYPSSCVLSNAACLDPDLVEVHKGLCGSTTSTTDVNTAATENLTATTIAGDETTIEDLTHTTSVDETTTDANTTATENPTVTKSSGSTSGDVTTIAGDETTIENQMQTTSSTSVENPTTISEDQSTILNPTDGSSTTPKISSTTKVTTNSIKTTTTKNGK